MPPTLWYSNKTLLEHYTLFLITFNNARNMNYLCNLRLDINCDVLVEWSQCLSTHRAITGATSSSLPSILCPTQPQTSGGWSGIIMLKLLWCCQTTSASWVQRWVFKWIHTALYDVCSFYKCTAACINVFSSVSYQQVIMALKLLSSI